MYCLVYGELHTSPKMDTFAPYFPAFYKAYLIKLMFDYLLGIHLVWSKASLNFFISFLRIYLAKKGNNLSICFKKYKKKDVI